jgi:3-oxoacyl-[acyl-carrier-protein] synthase II
MKRHAVITGLGIVSPIGVGVPDFWSAARAGSSGIGRPTLYDGSKLPPECQVVGEVRGFNSRDWMPGTSGKMAGRFSQFAVAASRMARQDSRLDSADTPPERVKVAIGTSLNGLTDVYEPNFEAFLRNEAIAPWTTLEFPAHAATSHVAIESGARGQATSFATACLAGLDAISWAAEQVKRGQATAVIAGAAETPLSASIVMALRAVGVLPKWLGPPEEASRPFDRLRSGLVIAEGAAVVVVEDEDNAIARGAQIYARILGVGESSEGAHLRKVDETGIVGARAMTLALQQAGISPKEIDYVAAHGNSMPDYDAAETASLKRVFGAQAYGIPVSSIKSMCGQALAASSAMQVVTACLTLRDQIVAPTINYSVRDPECDLDYVPNVARRARIRRALIHTHSLGGSHGAMVLGVPD